MPPKQMAIELTEEQKDEAREFIRLSTYFGRLTANQLDSLLIFWNATFPVPKRREELGCSSCVRDMIDTLKTLVK